MLDLLPLVSRGSDPVVCDLSIGLNAAQIRRASEWLEQVGREADIPDEQVGRLDICLNEALANVLTHADLPSEFPRVDLRIEIGRTAEGASACVTVSDHGAPFDPLSVEARPRPATLVEALPGGLGMTMIRKFSDSQRYRYLDGQNRLSFSVHWREPRHAESG